MTTAVRGLTGRPPGQVRGTEVEVVRWTGPAGEGQCTVVWLPTDRLDTRVASTGITAIERERAAGYHRDSDRLLSLGSAWLMRQVVAPLLDVAPLEVPIGRDCPRCARQHGRPVVGATTSEGERIQVSATHSPGLVGVAFSTSGAIGIDVENLQGRGPAAWPVVWRALGRAPVPAVPGGGPGAGSEPGMAPGSGDRSEPESVLVAARAWVRTEAVLKATGHGLGISPRSVRVSTGDTPQVTRWPWGDPDGHVSLFDLSPAGSYAGALAVIHHGIGWAVQVSR